MRPLPRLELLPGRHAQACSLCRARPVGSRRRRSGRWRARAHRLRHGLDGRRLRGRRPCALAGAVGRAQAPLRVAARRRRRGCCPPRQQEDAHRKRRADHRPELRHRGERHRAVQEVAGQDQDECGAFRPASCSPACGLLTLVAMRSRLLPALRLRSRAACRAREGRPAGVAAAAAARFPTRTRARSSKASRKSPSCGAWRSASRRTPADAAGAALPRGPAAATRAALEAAGAAALRATGAAAPASPAAAAAAEAAAAAGVVAAAAGQGADEEADEAAAGAEHTREPWHFNHFFRACAAPSRLRRRPSPPAQRCGTS